MVYRCVDDLLSFSNVAPKTKDLEREIVEQASIVFATAGNLVEGLKKWRKNVVFLPNGVDLNNFIRDKYSKPEIFTNISSPRVIYVGTLGSWFDVDLIVYAARRLMNVNFIIVGPIRTNCNHFKRSKNVQLIGPVDFEKVPDFLKYSDAALIPFKKSKLSDAVNPIKLYEYFSMGLPVVSTDIQEVTKMKSPAIITQTKEDFVKGIEIALQEGKNKSEFYRFAEENTWQARFQIIEKELSRL